MYAIEAHNLCCRYPNGRGVHGVDLAVGWGQCYALLGRNGSGKTTLTALLLGLLAPQSGRLRVLGQDVRPGGREHLRRTAGCLDSPVLWDALSGRQNLHFVGCCRGLRGADLRRRMDRLLDLAGLLEAADQPVATWSLGMRKKLTVIQALVDDADLVVLDEPTAAVDPQFRQALGEVIAQRTRLERTTWLAGNDPELVAEVATRAAFIQEGRLLAEAAVPDLLAELEPTSQVIVELARPHPVCPPPGLAGLKAFRQEQARLEATLPGDGQAVGRLIEHIALCGAELKSLEVRRATLREAFLARTGSAAARPGPADGSEAPP